jgi:hypothetical protein
MARRAQQVRMEVELLVRQQQALQEVELLVRQQQALKVQELKRALLHRR